MPPRDASNVGSAPRDATRTLRAPRDGVRAALAWTALLFALNLVWEVAQLPLYSLGSWSTWSAIAYAVLHCTAGDAGIALASYVVAAFATRSPRWPLERPMAGLAVAWLVAVVYTVWAEWQNVYVLRKWAPGSTLCLRRS